MAKTYVIFWDTLDIFDDRESAIKYYDNAIKYLVLRQEKGLIK